MEIVVERDIRPNVKNPMWMDLVMNFRRNPPHHVEDAASKYTYFAPPGASKPRQINLMGVTTAMSSFLYTYYKQKRKNAKDKKSPPGQSLSRTPVKKPRKHDSARVQGQIRGNIVHKHIQDLILLDFDSFERTHGKCHKMSHTILTSIGKRKWEPLVPEFLVYYLPFFLGHRIDLVAVDEDGILIFLEWKTGYLNSFEEGGSGLRWKSKFLKDSYPCTPETMALIQLNLGVHLAVQCLGLPLGSWRAYVVHMATDDQKEPNYIQLTEKFFTTRGNNVYAEIGKELIEERALKKIIKQEGKKKKIQ